MEIRAILTSVMVILARGCGQWHRNSISLVIIICAVGLPSSLLAQRATAVQGEARDRALSKYHDVSVTITPRRDRYFQGETVILDYQIKSHSRRACPWTEQDIKNCTILQNDTGERINHLILKLGDGSTIEDSGTVFEGSFKMFRWGNQRSEEEYGFRHLLPGRYTGYFDSGVVSPDFTFTIDPIPDSLVTEWHILRELSNIAPLGSSPSPISKREALERVSELLPTILARPRNAIFRPEELDAALLVFSLERDYWTTQDSTLCAVALTEVIRERDVLYTGLVVRAQGTIFLNLFQPDDQSRMNQAMQEFADSVGVSKFSQEVRRWVEQRNRSAKGKK